MSNSTSSIDNVGTAQPDPSKHVNFTQGMVLGVDDFTQEFAYHANRDHQLARDLIGYGTVSGLPVAIENDNGSYEISVGPGLALTPPGEFVRITRRQCAAITAWLARKENQDQLPAYALNDPSLGRYVRLYVTLSYRDVLTDNVPIPGEPCRTEEESMAASRLQDCYKLALSFTPPDQREEDAVRDLVAWLKQITVIDATPSDPVSSIDDVLAALRGATPDLSSPPAIPPASPPLDFVFGSPPPSLRIPRDETCAYWRAIFRFWVTELRPLWQAYVGYAACDCGSATTSPLTGSDPETSILLAEANVPLTFGGGLGNPVLLSLDEERRPYVIHLRLLQEWLFCGIHGVDSSGLGATGPQGPQGIPGPVGPAGPPGAPAALVGNFVERVDPSFRYEIEGAGIFEAQGNPIGPVYNKTTATVTPGGIPGAFLINFTGYTLPTPKFTYIVKGTPIGKSLGGFAFQFVAFLPTGIAILATQGVATAVGPASFMIEISKFGNF